MTPAKERDTRTVTRSTLGSASIDVYEEDILYIWGHLDGKRSLPEIWIRVVEHASRLAEAIRRDQYDRAQLELAGMAVWVMTFVGQARGAQRRKGADRLI